MDAMKDLRAFILIMAILAFVWLFTGGPLRPSSKSGWFLFRPQQKGEQRAKKESRERKKKWWKFSARKSRLMKQNSQK